MYEGCAIKHNPGVDTKTDIPVWWPFYYCMEKSQNAADTTIAGTCAKNNGLDWSVITTCAGSNPAQGSKDDGNPNMHQIALDTNALIPPHTFTPWVVVDGTPLTSAQINLPLTPIVCTDYSKINAGNSSCVLPSACGKPIVLDYLE